MVNYTTNTPNAKALKITSLISQLLDVYKEDTAKLIYHLYDKGYSVSEVGKILGVGKSAVSLQYPKNKRREVSK